MPCWRQSSNGLFAGFSGLQKASDLLRRELTFFHGQTPLYFDEESNISGGLNCWVQVTLLREGRVHLSHPITIVNERFGADFINTGQIFFDQIADEAYRDAMLGMAASANPMEKFALVPEGHTETLMGERMEQNEEIYARFTSDPTFRKVINEWLSKEVYDRFQQPLQTQESDRPKYGADS